jgi:hypothetical protein
LEHEIRREPVEVSAHGLIENLGRNLIHSGQVAIEHDLLTAYKIDLALNEFDRDYANRNG